MTQIGNGIGDGIVYKNVLAWRGCERLYLNERTCDVHFVFKTENDEIEKVPAHKSILSAISEPFDAMFFGPSKQDGDIHIVDTSAGAFKEFLQYFYLSTVKLTAENVAEVMNLAKQYMLNDCLNACTDFCEKSLTLDNMCWGYELAILFEQDALKTFCERKISENPKEIFQSNSFLICDKNLLRRILQLDSLKCDESVVFDGCMAWAKATCIQKGLDDQKAKNLRAQLGDLFDEIRFGRMTVETFYTCYQSYEDLFSSNEFKSIVGKIASKEFQPRSIHHFQSKNGDVLVCNRDNSARHIPLQNLICTEFISNSLLILKSFICDSPTSSTIHNGGMNTYRILLSVKLIKIRICENRTDIYTGHLLHAMEKQLSVENEQDILVELHPPITIKPGVKYSIDIDIGYRDSGRMIPQFEHGSFQKTVHMNQGRDIDFLSKTAMIKCLNFIPFNQ